jgi:thioredoxin reductase
MPFIVLEASDGVAASFASTAHVRLFSSWQMNVDRAAARLLERVGWDAPDPAELPTAGELRTQYLEPLATLLGADIRFGVRVESVSRRGFDKVKTTGRESAPFVLRLRTSAGHEDIEASAVIDASGTWANPSWMGANGLPAIGEREHAARIRYGMPDVLGSQRSRYANKRVLVVGAGHSAAGSLLALAELASSAPRTSIVWAVRGKNLARVFGGGESDGLPERGELGSRLRALVDAGQLELVRGLHIEAVTEHGARLTVQGTGETGAEHIENLDEIIVATGARPDLSLARELRLRLDPWLESSEALAPLIDPNVHNCGSVPPHGHRELSHPEAGYYAVGAKSYGRAPNFLLATGYEQVRSVVAALAGDLASADHVQLELPETGVCSVAVADQGGGCCAVPAQPAATGCCPVPREPAPRSCCA